VKIDPPTGKIKKKDFFAWNVSALFDMCDNIIQSWTISVPVYVRNQNILYFFVQKILL